MSKKQIERLDFVSVLGIPQEVTDPILQCIDVWESACGQEWTVSRLKSIKTDFLRTVAGQPMVAPWVARRGGTFVGPFKGLLTCMKTHKNFFKKALRLLNYYTIYVSSKTTEKQEKKFLDGVYADPVSIDVTRYKNIFSKSLSKLSVRPVILPKPKPLAMVVPSPLKREPHADGRSFFEGEASLECALSFTRGTHIGWDFRGIFREIFDSVEEGLVLDDHRDSDTADYPNSVGKIGFIQEPGFKLRAVANPSRVYQQALEPLGTHVFSILQKMPWDCTHDQLKGLESIQSKLRSGVTVHSVDLRGATDYFPLSVQILLLEQLIVPGQKDVRLFESLSKSPWRYKDGFIRWKKGQPLGLYPSFASFALTHGILLFALNNYKHDGEFFVLGDDVVILSDVLHQKYMSLLTELQCPVSMDKCISSNVLCEFAGRVITTHSSLSSPKWRQPSDDSFIDFVKNIGPKAIGLLRKRQRDVIHRICYVPDFMGGLGFNPKGLPLAERMYKYYCDFPDNGMTYLMGYNRLLNSKNYYNGEKFPQYRRCSIETADPDQGLDNLVLRYIPTMFRWYHILGRNLFDVNPDLGLQIDGNNGHVTRLVSMERLSP